MNGAELIPLASTTSSIFIGVIVVAIVVAFVARARRSGVKDAIKRNGPPTA